MPLLVFEDYILHNNLSGYPQDHWDKVVEQYDQLTGGEGGSDTKHNICLHTELVTKYNVWHAALDTMVLLAQKNCYAPRIAANCARRFKLSFSRETLAEDIQTARSKLKAVDRQITDIQELLPTGEEKVNNTFFDDILQAYESVFSVSPNKETMTVQQFGIRYMKLKERIEHDNKQRNRDGESG